ncbi:chaplin [Actinomadura alba]|uniref:Chaplin n=1 Tax=Actinomadura alba TaxID=406431 RepID=A0ABR7LT03_9ACTN|nr:chaplin [Actinomadura alba]MBC6467978.1 chaplin [Actinomadura alba]
MLSKIAATGVVAVAAAGAMMIATPAQADNFTRGDHSILGGNQIFAPISIPINVCGNSVAVIGFAGSGCKGGAKVKGHHGY